MPPSRVTTRPSPARRRPVRFCLALPRRAIGAFGLPVPMKVAKLVMPSATELVSRPSCPIIRSARASRRARCSGVTTCVASRNRRWPGAGAGILVNRSAAAAFRQSAKASFEQGATSRFSAASAR